MSTLCERPVVGGTQTVGGFTDLPYPPTEPSYRGWNGEREDTVTIVVGEKPAWIDEVVSRLNELAQLAADWDPRGSAPISFRDVEAAADFLNLVMKLDSPAPAITPLPSGGLELAWSVDGIELEIVFDSANDERSAILDLDGDESELSPEDAARCVGFLGPRVHITG